MKAQTAETSFTHKPAFSADVQEVLQPIFSTLTDNTLLERCLGKNNQNINEYFNSVIWSMVPKHHFTSGNIVEIASWIAVCLFNEGHMTLINIFEAMGVECGETAYNYTIQRDEKRIRFANYKSKQSTKEARTAKKKALEEQEKIYEDIYGLLYAPGIDDLS